MKLARFVSLLAVLAFNSYSQTPALLGHDDFQSWNDLFLTVPMSKRVDFFTRLTAQFSKNISRLDDQRFAVGIVWKPTKALSISPFYWYLNARNPFGKFRIENELNLAVTYRFPTKRFGLSHRSQIERRLRLPVNSWRYRAQLTIDKDIPKHLIPKAKWFVSDEVFYDSFLKRFSRNRFAAGITKTLHPHLSVDIYYMRQNDGVARPGNLHTIWTAWKIKA